MKILSGAIVRVLLSVGAIPGIIVMWAIKNSYGNTIGKLEKTHLPDSLKDKLDKYK